MTADELILEKLDELIAVTRAASVPGEMRWVSADTAAAMLDITKRAFLREYACKPDFPPACRVGHPRWKATEVSEWMEDTRSKRHQSGRKRSSL